MEKAPIRVSDDCYRLPKGLYLPKYTKEEVQKDLEKAFKDNELNNKAMKERYNRRKNLRSKKLLLENSNSKSEDSESSLDAWIDRHIEWTENRYQDDDLTDPDEIIYNDDDDDLTSWRHCSPNLVESDSVNENHSMSKETRRKRKFKRMTVDPPLGPDDESLPSTVTQKYKRSHYPKSPKLPNVSTKSSKLSKVTVSELSSEMENFCMDFGNAATSSGKRKRCAHEKSVECSECCFKTTIPCKENSELLKVSFNQFHLLDRCNSKSQEINYGDLSSSESECGILTNDEGREGDDEQSDFFQDSVPICRNPIFTPPWKRGSKEEKLSNVDFPGLMTKGFGFLTQEKSQVQYDKDTRVIRAGGRRLGNKMACGTDELFPNLPQTNEYNCILSSGDNFLTKTMLNEKKKMKGMPPVHDYGECSSTEANVGSHASKKSGWIPSLELGKSGDGISPSNKDPETDGKQEFGFINKRDKSVVSGTVHEGNP